MLTVTAPYSLTVILLKTSVTVSQVQLSACHCRPCRIRATSVTLPPCVTRRQGGRPSWPTGRKRRATQESCQLAAVGGPPAALRVMREGGREALWRTQDQGRWSGRLTLPATSFAPGLGPATSFAPGVERSVDPNNYRPPPAFSPRDPTPLDAAGRRGYTLSMRTTTTFLILGLALVIAFGAGFNFDRWLHRPIHAGGFALSLISTDTSPAPIPPCMINCTPPLNDPAGDGPDTDDATQASCYGDGSIPCPAPGRIHPFSSQMCWIAPFGLNACQNET